MGTSDRAESAPPGDERDDLRRRAEAAEAELARLRLREVELRQRIEVDRKLFVDSPVARFRTRLGEGGLFDVNRKFCDLFGASPDELTAGRLRLVHAAERAEMRRQLAAHGGFDDLELAVDTGRGIKTILASGTMFQGYLEGIAVDITARKQAEAAHRETMARLQLVFETTSDLLVLLRVDGEELSVVEMNAAYRGALRQLFGFDATTMLGKDRTTALASMGVPRELIEFELPAYARAVASRTTQQYELALPAGDTTLHLDVRIEPVVGPDGAVTHVLYGARDVTARKRATDKVVASLREKEALLHEIHHRVKNNLQIVSSLLYLQAGRSGDPRLTEALQDSRNRVAAIALVHQKLYQSANLAEIPFEAYAEDLARALYQAHGETAARVRFEVAAGAHVLAIDTAVPCGLVLHEIVSNALRHAFPAGRGGTIRVELGLDADGWYQLTVADDGVGLPPDFEERCRASLGVDLIGRLVTQLEGALVRTSSAGGTTYQIRFPRAR